MKFATVQVLCRLVSLCPLPKYLGVQLLGHLVNLCLTFSENDAPFSKGAAPFCVSTSRVRGARFSSFRLTFVIVYLFNYSHSSVCEVLSYCAFNLHFPND